jgi:hypothetical protein
MDFPENLEISGRTAELVKAYLEQWRDLARGSSGMELVRFFEHIRRRVLLDNDTPEVRRWLCMVAIKACNDLADFGRTLTGAERAAAVQCGALAEMFRQIAEDEDEITVEMDVPRSAGLPVEQFLHPPLQQSCPDLNRACADDCSARGGDVQVSARCACQGPPIGGGLPQDRCCRRRGPDRPSHQFTKPCRIWGKMDRDVRPNGMAGSIQPSHPRRASSRIFRLGCDSAEQPAQVH